MLYPNIFSRTIVPLATTLMVSSHDIVIPGPAGDLFVQTSREALRVNPAKSSFCHFERSVPFVISSGARRAQSRNLHVVRVKQPDLSARCLVEMTEGRSVEMTRRCIPFVISSEAFPLSFRAKHEVRSREICPSRHGLLSFRAQSRNLHNDNANSQISPFASLSRDDKSGTRLVFACPVLHLQNVTLSFFLTT